MIGIHFIVWHLDRNGYPSVDDRVKNVGFGWWCWP